MKAAYSVIDIGFMYNIMRFIMDILFSINSCWRTQFEFGSVTYATNHSSYTLSYFCNWKLNPIFEIRKTKRFVKNDF